MKLNILMWLIIVIANVLMWQYFLSTRDEFQSLPAWNMDKDILHLPMKTVNRLKI